MIYKENMEAISSIFALIGSFLKIIQYKLKYLILAVCFVFKEAISTCSIMSDP